MSVDLKYRAKQTKRVVISKYENKFIWNLKNQKFLYVKFAQILL